jgi:hypothetical protein
MGAFHIHGSMDRWVLLGGLALCLGLTGCESDGQGGVSRMSARSVPYLEGVPVPSGFDLVEKLTEDYESGGQRTARHRYRGFGKAHDVREFYREQMPNYNWTRVSDQSVKGVVTLRFERPREACTVVIDSNWMNYTDIEVIINPFSRTPVSEPPRRSPS